VLTGFEKHTAPLTEKELSFLLPKFLAGFEKRIGKDNAVTSTAIVESFKNRFNYKLSDVTIRKIVNHIRNNNLLPGLVACSSGYYVTNNPREVEDYIKSLASRENEINRIKKGMIEYHKQLTGKVQTKIF
jgi:hypothetical protein